MKRYLAEMIGTMVLVLMGCGTAVSLNCGVDPASVVGTAIAFGLAVVAMAYTIGGISGCHINPAITLGCLLSGRISGKDVGSVKPSPATVHRTVAFNCSNLLTLSKRKSRPKAAISFGGELGIRTLGSFRNH